MSPHPIPNSSPKIVWSSKSCSLDRSDETQQSRAPDNRKQIPPSKVENLGGTKKKSECMRERVQTRDFRSHPPTDLSCVIYPFAGVENSRHLDVISEHKIGRSSNPKASPPRQEQFLQNPLPETTTDCFALGLWSSSRAWWVWKSHKLRELQEEIKLLNPFFVFFFFLVFFFFFFFFLGLLL